MGMWSSVARNLTNYQFRPAEGRPLLMRVHTAGRPIVLFASFLALSCTLPSSRHSLAVPNQVSAARDAKAMPLRAQPNAVRRSESGKSLTRFDPHQRSPQASARDCKRLAKASDPLPPEWRREAAFALRLGEDASAQRLQTAVVMPGDELQIEVLDRHRRASFAADTDGGALRPTSAATWSWRAPQKPGLYALRVVDRFDGEAVCINAFVMRPYDGRDSINGFRVGTYQRRPLGGDPAYAVPKGFIEVTPDIRSVWVAPHFQLEQFLCKQSSGDVEYLSLSPRLLHKLEYLLAKARDRGIKASTFQILSAFRTPWHNRRAGNDTSYSRHVYGDAADIFVDEDGDGVMDDLDGDGRITARDADVLYELVEDSMHDHAFQPFIGGLALYHSAAHRGPFVHVDARGTPIRWGKRIAARSTPAHLTQRNAASERDAF